MWERSVKIAENHSIRGNSAATIKAFDRRCDRLALSHSPNAKISGRRQSCPFTTNSTIYHTILHSNIYSGLEMNPL